MPAQGYARVGALLAQLGLPILGRVLSGAIASIPIVGGILTSVDASGIIIRAIANALGVDADPDSIENAIEGGDTTEVLAKLRTIEGEAKARWPALADIAEAETSGEVEIAKINAKAAADIGRDMVGNNFWMSLYRPILMYTATINLIGFGICFWLAIFVYHDIFKLLTDGWMIVSWWIGGNASILGVHFYTRGKERQAGATAAAAAANAPIAETINAVTNKQVAPTPIVVRRR